MTKPWVGRGSRFFLCSVLVSPVCCLGGVLLADFLAPYLPGTAPVVHGFIPIASGFGEEATPPEFAIPPSDGARALLWLCC